MSGNNRFQYKHKVLLKSKKASTKTPKRSQPKLLQTTSAQTQPNYGLQNPGNLWYANALFQASIFKYFNNGYVANVNYWNEIKNKSPCISNTILNIIKQLLKASGPVKPTNFHEAVLSYFPNTNKEEDALELFAKLISSIEEHPICCPASQFGMKWTTDPRNDKK